MSMRTVEPRKSIVSLNPSELRLPFAYIQKQFGYPIESIIKQIHCEPVVHLGTYPDTFPNTIQEYYWISTSSGTWYALGKLQNGLYFLYNAHCTNTFLNGNGLMYLWVSTRYSSLINFAMNETMYQKYIVETSAVLSLLITSINPRDAISQMSHQASDVLEVSVGVLPPVPFAQSLVNQ